MATLSEDEFRALLEQEQLLSQLTEHPGWQELVAIMHDRMNSDKKAILNGNVGSHDQYLKRAGILVGIHEVLDMPGTVAQLVANERERRNNS